MAKMETFGCLWNEAREPSAVSVLLVEYACIMKATVAILWFIL